jgi:hypothetical protein
MYGLPILSEGAETGESEEIFTSQLVRVSGSARSFSLISGNLECRKFDLGPVLGRAAGNLKGLNRLVVGSLRRQLRFGLGLRWNGRLRGKEWSLAKEPNTDETERDYDLTDKNHK